MRKYLHANGNCSTAQWYDHVSAGNPVDPPGDGDYADLNGYTLTMDIAVFPASGTLSNLESPAKSGRLSVDLNSVGNRIINAGTIRAGSNPSNFINITGTTYILTINAQQIIGGTNSGNLCVQNNNAATVNINCPWIIGGGAISAAHAIQNQSTGIINIVGNVHGGAGSNYGVNNLSTGTINITGNVAGSEYTKDGIGVNNYSTGQINLTGNLIYKTAIPYSGVATGLIITAGSQYYVRIGNMKFPQELSGLQVLKGVRHGDLTGMLSPASPFRRSKNRFV